jgi:hypothetical protein
MSDPGRGFLRGPRAGRADRVRQEALAQMTRYADLVQHPVGAGTKQRLRLSDQNHPRYPTSRDLPQAKPGRVQLAIDGEAPPYNLAHYYQVGRCTL